MARAQGARALMALEYETVYGTSPVGGFTRMPFASTSLGSEQLLLNSALLGYATTFAAFMAGRWVAGLAVAALSVRGLATALVFLRGALIRTGIGALIVGAGELVYQFSGLVARVGGVGEAWRSRGAPRRLWRPPKGAG